MVLIQPLRGHSTTLGLVAVSVSGTIGQRIAGARAVEPVDDREADRLQLGNLHSVEVLEHLRPNILGLLRGDGTHERHPLVGELDVPHAPVVLRGHAAKPPRALHARDGVGHPAG